MGASFTDCLNRKHDLKIVVSHLRFLRERGFDLSKPTDAISHVDQLLVETPEKVVEVAYRIRLEPQDITPEEFAAGFDGPAMWAAACALSHAIIDFFPVPTVAEKLRSALEKVLNPNSQQTPNPSTSSDTVTRPPESADTTPAVTPSES